MKIIINRIILFPAAAALLLAEFSAPAQDTPLYRRGYTIEESTMPPSPEPASAVRYVDAPFSHCQGMAEYDVPFYTIRGRELSIPLSLHYASGGIRLDEIAGVAGLGWNLVAGGCVTRTVEDMPDEFSAPLMEHALPSGALLDSLSAMQGSDAEYTFLVKLSGHRTDSSLDRFSYNAMGLSGSFVITDDGTVVQLEGDGVIITPNRNDGGIIVSFTITGPDGTVYAFSETETASHDGSGDAPFTPTSGEPDKWDAVTAWHLTSITSPTGMETATFTYSPAGTWERNVYTVSKTLSCTRSTSLGENASTSTSTSFIANSYSAKVLSSISLAGFTASFTYASGTGRCRHGVSAGNPAMNYPARLTGIAVTAPGGTVTDSLAVGTMRHSYDGRIILSSLRLYRRGILDDRWDFTYKTLSSTVSRYSQDWFGFYNAEVENGTPRGDLCPFSFQPSSLNPVLTFGEPDPSAATYMSLLTADHDGAKTTFSYEGASATASGKTVSIGVRVARMTLSDAGTVRKIRRFFYANPVADGPAYPTVDMYATVSAALGMVTPFSPSCSWTFTLHEGPVTDGHSISGTRVLHTQVTDDDFADKLISGPASRTVWLFDVTGLRFGETNTLSRFPSTWAPYYSSTTYAPSMVSPWDGVRDGFNDDGPALPPVPMRKDVYSWESGTYKLVSSTSWDYGAASRQSVLTGYRATQVMQRLEYGHTEYGDYYHYPVYTTSTLGRTPTRTVTIGYHPSGNDTTTVSTSWLPRSSIEAPARIASLSSIEAGTLRSLSFDYPDTWQAAGTWTSSLVRAHRLDSPIRKKYGIVAGGSPLPVPTWKTETFSFAWTDIAGTQRLLPSLHRELNRGTESWKDSVITRDCLGGVSSFKERGAPTTVVVRSYSGLHPVAVIRNATMPEVAAALGGQAAVDAVTTAAAPSSAMLQALDALREALPGALVYTFTFEPGTGMTGATDPAGIRTSYSYDNGGRLASVRDADGNLLADYTYSFLNNGGNGRLNARTRTYTSDDGTSFREDVRWWNTLGLVTQDIALAAAGDGRDLVSARGHDAMLHDDARVFLPYPAASTAGAFQTGAEAAAAAFHGSLQAYALTSYERSVRDRVVSSALPGYASSHPASLSDDTVSGMPALYWDDASGVDSLGLFPGASLVRETAVDADGRTTFSVADHAGRTIASYAGVDGSTPASSRSMTRYVYDGFDQLRAVVPPGVPASDTLSAWRYSYDAVGRLASKGVPGCARESYAYDSEDRPVRVLRGGDLAETGYDPHGRVLTVHVTPAGGTRALREEHHYDAYPAEAAPLLALSAPSGTWNGPSAGLETFRREAVTGPQGTVTGYVSTLFLYDTKGRPAVTVSSFPDGGILREDDTYAFSGEVISSVTTYTRPGTVGTQGTLTDTLSLSFGYDIRGRLTSAVSSLGTVAGTPSQRTVTAQYRYDCMGRACGRSAAVSGGASLSSLDSYALQGWTLCHSDSLAGAPLFTESLTRDGTPVLTGAVPSYTGLITGRTEGWSLPVPGGAAATLSSTTAFAYDAAARLVREWTSGSDGATFSYDRAGGMTSAVTTTGGTSVSEAYSFSGPRPVSLTRSGGGSPAATFGFSYDGLGRMTSDALSGTGVAYNTLDLPSRVTDAAGNVLADYSYTASGTKVEALDASGNGLLYRGPFVYRKGSGGVTTLESAVVPEGRITPSGALLYVRDHLGSVRAVVDGNSGTVLKASAYSAYGSPSGVTAGAFVPGTVSAGVTLRDAFSGKEDQQPDFGVPWLDFGARAYSPALRRWMVPDPLGEKYYGVNPYAYCNGDPVNYVDPEGRDWYQKTDSTTTYVWYEGNEDIKGLEYYGPRGSILGEAETLIDELLTMILNISFFSEGFQFTIRDSDTKMFDPTSSQTLFDEFLYNQGPEFSVFLQDHTFTQDLMNASTVQESRFCLWHYYQLMKNEKKWKFWDAITNTSYPQQFIGSFKYLGKVSKGGQYIYNAVYDSKSRSSLFYHIIKDNKTRKESNMLGNSYQLYVWVEFNSKV